MYISTIHVSLLIIKYLSAELMLCGRQLDTKVLKCIII